jgi:galactoside O-acetyltransferase
MSNQKIDNGWYTEEQLKEQGFNSIGENVFISNKCSIYGASNIDIGSNVRIDDFCVITAFSGKLVLEGYNHIAAHCYINAASGITFEMFSSISSRCSLYSSSDVYDGSCLTGPMIPKKYSKIKNAPIILRKHVLLGTNCVVLPGCELGIGSAAGAFSLINKDVPEFKIVVGIPAKIVKDRKKDILFLEKDLLSIKN